ncbi:MAG: DUF5069 domain-containing protein [Nitrospirae bacterium]|nr:MAG: DUF5069 domain-containing protein [Nitrospirota bacterium]
MDLRVDYPRSMRDRLGGYVHLARMIDKCRAKLAGTLGEYRYPCPLDQRLLEFLGVSAEQFLHAVDGRSDDDMVTWLAHHAKPHTPEEIESWNDMMLHLGPDSDEKWAFFRQVRDSIDPTRTDITTWADLLDLEEHRPVPLRMLTDSSSHT